MEQTIQTEALFEELSIVEVEDRLAFASAERCSIGAASTATV